MRKAVYIFIAILGIASACTHQSKPTLRSLLQEVEDVVHTAPDSAYYLLQNVLAGQMLTEEDSTYFQLLMAEAQLHNQLKIEDTAAMHSLTLYYKEKQDTLMQARAQRLYAVAHRDLGFYDATVQHYNTAIALAKEIGYKRLLADAYFELANIYYFEGLRLLAEPPRILADSLFYLTEQTAEALKDTALWINSLLSHSVIPDGRKHYDELESQLLLALHLSEETKDQGHEAAASMRLSIMYAELGKKELSFSYAQRNLALRKELIPAYLYYLTLGNAYQRIGEKDSANHYIERSKALKERGERAKYSTPSPYLTEEFKKDISLNDWLERMKMNDEHHQQSARKRTIYMVSILILALVSITVVVYLRKHHLHREARQKEKLSFIQQEIEALSSDAHTVFDKINRIIEDYLYKDRSDIQLEEADWKLLQIHIDKQWNHAVSHIQKEFRLTPSETRLLCLNLTDLPTAHMPFLFNRAINTIYVKNRNLCRKLGINRSDKTFKEDFKNFIDSRG